MNIAWAAGIFEGEGYIRDVLNCKRSQAELQLQMCDLDVVRKFQSALGCGGSITCIESNKQNVSTIYRLCITGKQRVANALSLMLPYFGERRSYAALNTLDFIDGCL